MTPGSSQIPKRRHSLRSQEYKSKASCSVYVASSVWPSQVLGDICLSLDQVAQCTGVPLECNALLIRIRSHLLRVATRQLLKRWSSGPCDLSLAPSRTEQHLADVIRLRVLTWVRCAWVTQRKLKWTEPSKRERRHIHRQRRSEFWRPLK